jgi:hypothetical protein
MFRGPHAPPWRIRTASRDAGCAPPARRPAVTGLARTLAAAGRGAAASALETSTSGMQVSTHFTIKLAYSASYDAILTSFSYSF